MLLGMVALMIPWWVRNALVVGHFVPTTLQVGASLYDGLNPAATGASNMSAIPPFVAAERQRWAANPAARAEPFEYWLDQRLRQEALRWAWHHPKTVVKLAVIKLARLWNIWPNEPQLAASWPIRIGVVFTFLPIVILGIIGIRHTAGRGWAYSLGWLPAVYLSGLHLVFVSSLRYREPAMLALVVLAAAALGSVRLGAEGWAEKGRAHCSAATTEK